MAASHPRRIAPSVLRDRKAAVEHQENTSKAEESEVRTPNGRADATLIFKTTVIGLQLLLRVRRWRISHRLSATVHYL